MGRTGVCEECPRLGQGSLVGSRAEGQDPVRAVGGPTAPIPKAETGEAGLEKALHKDPEAETLTLHSSLDGSQKRLLSQGGAGSSPGLGRSAWAHQRSDIGTSTHRPYCSVYSGLLQAPLQEEAGVSGGPFSGSMDM